jgi:hypothetical protein
MHLVESQSTYSLLYHYPIPSTALKLERLSCFYAVFQVRMPEVRDKEAPALVA